MNKMQEAFDALFESGKSDMSNDEETFYIFSAGYQAAIEAVKAGGPVAQIDEFGVFKDLTNDFIPDGTKLYSLEDV